MSALGTLVRLGIELAADLVRDALRERRPPQPPRPTASVRDVDRMAEDARACAVPPSGWVCSRIRGHDGPCAARPTKPD